MSARGTAWQILNAAEELFYEKGFAETSLRMITTKAKVNLAAVNYHFGSKKELIQAVFERFLQPFCADLSTQLDTQPNLNTNLEYFFHVLAKTLANLDQDNPKRVQIFMRLLGLAYVQEQGHLRRFIKQQHGKVFARCADIIRELTPQLNDEERFWRLHFAIGASIFTLSGMDSLAAMAEYDLGKSTQLNLVTNSLLPFLTAGLQTPAVIPK